MTTILFNGLLALAAVVSFVMAGIYFAFSGFIMSSLNNIGAKEAAIAMNSINEEIVRSSFIPLFFGSSILAVLILIAPLLSGDIAYSVPPTAGSVTYLIGMFSCTVVFNVPLNNRLVSAISSGKDPEQEWKHYFRYWTRWNHLRTVCCAVSGSFFGWAFYDVTQTTFLNY